MGGKDRSGSAARLSRAAPHLTASARDQEDRDQRRAARRRTAEHRPSRSAATTSASDRRACDAGEGSALSAAEAISSAADGAVTRQQQRISRRGRSARLTKRRSSSAEHAHVSAARSPAQISRPSWRMRHGGRSIIAARGLGPGVVGLAGEQRRRSRPGCSVTASPRLLAAEPAERLVGLEVGMGSLRQAGEQQLERVAGRDRRAGPARASCAAAAGSARAAGRAASGRRRRRRGWCRCRAPCRRRSRPGRSGRARPRCGSSTAPARAAVAGPAPPGPARPPPQPRPAPAGQREQRQQSATARYSARTSVRAPEQRPGGDPPAAPAARPRRAGRRGRRRRAGSPASGSVISSPWYSRSAG